MKQYICTALPQGFTDSPHVFARALEKDLKNSQLKQGAILWEVGDILVYSTSQKFYITM